jgi:competence protein ComEC
VIANDFLIGDTDPPDPELASSIAERFRDSGTIHLLVVSGTQVTLVVAPFLLLGIRFYRARWLLWLLGVIALGLFYVTTENSVSVLRAAVMGGAAVLALAFRREPDVENTLGLSALGLLFISPLEVFDVGALLTFGAVWSLARLAPVLEKALGPRELEAGQSPWGLRYRAHLTLAQVLAAAVAAHMLTAPVLAATRQRTTWSGIPANVAVFAVSCWFTYVALAHVVLTALHAPFVSAWLVEYSAKALLGWATFFSRPPFGAADVFPPPMWLVPGLLVGAAVPSFLPKDRVRPLAWALALAATLALSDRLPAAPPEAPTLRAIDVGQGDALLLQGPDGSNILVDAGPIPLRSDSSPLVRALRALRVAELDAVVVSHGHKDHMGGLPAVLDAIPARMLVHDVRTGDWAEWSRALEAAARHHLPVVIPNPGDRLRIRDSTLTALGPLQDPTLPPPADPNDESLVMRWDSGGARFLLTGDTGQNTEPELLRWGPELRSDVLKVGHHGSRMATSAAWLAAVQPRAAVISCGRDNSYGHPAPETVSRLLAARVPVARTDRGGMVTVRVRNRRVETETYLHE